MIFLEADAPGQKNLTLCLPRWRGSKNLMDVFRPKVFRVSFAPTCELLARSFCLSVCLCMCLSVYVSNTSFYLSLYTNRSFVLSFCLRMSPILPFIISLFTPWMISYLTISRTHTLSCYYAGTAYSFFLSVYVSKTSLYLSLSLYPLDDIFSSLSLSLSHTNTLALLDTAMPAPFVLSVCLSLSLSLHPLHDIFSFFFSLSLFSHSFFTLIFLLSF